MKKIALLLATISLLVSCNKDKYVVTGTIKGIENGKNVFLEKQDEMGQLKAVDTVQVKDGKFSFEGKAAEPEIHLIQVDGANGKVPFILENGDITMVINKDSIMNTKVTGTYNNDELTSYKKSGEQIQKKMMKFQEDNMAKMTEAQQKKDTVVMNSLRAEYMKFQEDFAKQSDTYVASHPKAFISALIIEGMFNQMAPDVKKIEEYYNKLDKSLQGTKPGKSIKTKLDQIKNPTAAPQAPAMPQGAAPAPAKWGKVGKQAPDFSAKSPDGKLISLKESLGKVTIIDFWASWCGPCRRENPNVVALYNEFHSKGLNIIGVSLDEDLSKWKDAIAKDKITWTQVSNLKGWQDPIAKQYEVEQIPTTFLLDANGKFIARDLFGEELKAKIQELLSSK